MFILQVMRAYLPVVILVFFVVFVSVSFANKAADTTVGIDYMKRDFGELNEVLPAGANISVAYKDVDSASFINTFMLFRYILTPRYVSIDPKEFDTVFTFFGREPSAAGLHAVIDNRKVLWEKKGSNCFFVLTAKKQ
jgi:hypothetical protein